jgi:hypothetical protein
LTEGASAKVFQRPTKGILAAAQDDDRYPALRPNALTWIKRRLQLRQINAVAA